MRNNNLLVPKNFKLKAKRVITIKPKTIEPNCYWENVLPKKATPNQAVK